MDSWGLLCAMCPEFGCSAHAYAELKGCVMHPSPDDSRALRNNQSLVCII